jgi:co-chaperonin GroES (HSP10)
VKAPRLTVVPCGDLIVVNEKRKSEINGIVVPGTAEEFIHTVDACGPDVTRCKAGDRVLVAPRGAVAKVERDGSRVLVHEEAILAVVTGDTEETGSSLVIP